jgi:SagB-type dehydrogenase family enzyme
VHSQILTYHDGTKHHFRAFAPSLGYLDWATQPNPFRRYMGAPLIRLSLVPTTPSPSYEEPFSPVGIPSRPLDFNSVSRLFHDALAISAWKQAGSSRWSLRINPSSGNLHPSEGYLVTGPVPGIHDTPAVFHYAPLEHGLELRTEFSIDVWNILMRGFPAGSFFLGLTSIHWRESWKYGERAYRYCQHDAGHAIAALSLAAAACGWESRLLSNPGDDRICRLLGLGSLEDPDAEHPDCLLAVYPAGIPYSESPLPDEAVAAVAAGEWKGRPNILSRSHHPWPMIEEAARAAWKPDTGKIFTGAAKSHFSPQPSFFTPAPFREIVHRRRSAVALDGKTTITRKTFYKILQKTLPLPERIPFETLPWPVSIHLGLFVHRVEEIPPGLYALVRHPEKLSELKEFFRESFAWAVPPGCPDDLPLYLLAEGRCTDLAARVSCFQEIAGDGAFSLGMIAEFEKPLKEYGNWFYRRLFWETGVVGQVLYLEAEAEGIRGTGIGCFFDDPVHEIFGLRGHRYQSLYHFTMGGPVEDPRIMTLPPYPDAPAG